MSATTSVKTAKCQIRYTDDTLSVTSTTGKTLAISLTDGFNMREQTIINRLTCGIRARTEDLSYDEMKVLLEVNNRQAAKSLDSSAKAVVDNVSNRTRVYGCTDEAEKRLNTLQAVVEKTSKSNYVMLVYDIPTNKNKDCPNPSHELWFHGFRINLSCWVLPKDQLAHPRIQRLMQHWSNHHIKVHVVEYAESQRDKIRAIARENLDAEIVRLHTSLIECIQSADERYKEAEKKLDESNAGRRAYDLADAYRDNQIRAIIRKSGESLNAAIACARVFDEEENLQQLLQGLREAIKSQTLAFNAAMRAKGSKGVPLIN